MAGPGGSGRFDVNIHSVREAEPEGASGDRGVACSGQCRGRAWEAPGRDLPSRGPVSFALAFVTQQVEVESIARSLAPLAEGDAVIWFAYPKGTSRRYKCDFNRDTGWAALGAAGFEGVRLVSIDEDWSAMRFRRAEFIKALARNASRAMSVKGRRRVAKRR